MILKNNKIIKYLLSVWNINKNIDITEIKINFLEGEIRLYSDDKFVGNYNLLPERQLELQNYINNL